MTKLSKCNQTRCGFLQMGQGCRKCDSCGAEPYLVNDNCDRCWNCENDEGDLRWDDDNGISEEKVKEKEKPIEIPMR